MEITWYGLSCFRLTERGAATIVTDPYSPEIGLAELKLKADVVTISHEAPGHSHLAAVKGYRRLIDGPGEYEIGDVFITAILMEPKSKKDNGRPNILYVFEYDGFTIAHLGDLAYVPSQSQIEDLGTVDVALVPVGGGSALAPSKAAEVISLIEPSIVIPMHYKIGKETPELDDVSRFLKEMGIVDLEPVESLKLTKSDLSEQTQVIQLQPAG
jgi:L-ascorbate metabolism protein UlaG (beta-lactamase superfamily)